LNHRYSLEFLSGFSLQSRDIQPTRIRGVFFRHVPAGGDPLFQPQHPADGRWQRGEIVEGFYLADSERTAWGEWYRALAELAVPPMSSSFHYVTLMMAIT
jgi:hypothetical protein